MRITVIDVEHDDAGAAIAAINAALGASTPTVGSQTLTTPVVAKTKSIAAPEKTVAERVTLPQSQAETWNWMVANDAEGGHTPTEIAKGLDIKPATAVWRVNALRDRGLCHRVRRGYYRAGEK